jgi:flavin reductase (DIM6/NTAB) family NADH-FMN oxidoreductase RutF
MGMTQQAITGISASDLGVDATYKLLVGSVVPRPIAWVTTLNEAGKVNLAPFSWFTVASIDPPIVVLNCGRRLGEVKDTPRNAQREGEMVVNIANEELVWDLHESSAELPPEESEAERLGIALAPSQLVRTPRVASAPIAMECRFERILEVGRARSLLTFAEVVYFNIRSDLLAGGKIRTESLKPLARVGGPTYARLGEYLTLPAAGTLGSLETSIQVKKGFGG